MTTPESSLPARTTSDSWPAQAPAGDEDSLDSKVIDPAIVVAAIEREMIAIEGGTFRMGDITGRGGPEARPVHRVTVPPFRILRHEVTAAQFAAFAHDARFPRADGESRKPQSYPATRVTFDEAVAFAVWLSRRSGRPYRLPSEVEWEYAARSGTESDYPWGDDFDPRFANVTVHGRAVAGTSTGVLPVCSLAPTGRGLCDVIGNVWEWTADCWNEDYFGAPTDGSARSSGNCQKRVIRGGGWAAEPVVPGSSTRFRYVADAVSPHVGFRVVSAQ